MLTFLKKNAITLLIGLIIGSIATAISAAVYHNMSKKTQTLAHERVLVQKNKLIQQCIDKPSNAITNEFNPEIGKNKKGTILINTVPNIDNNMSVLERQSNQLIKQGIQQPKDGELEPP